MSSGAQKRFIALTSFPRTPGPGPETSSHKTPSSNPPEATLIILASHPTAAISSNKPASAAPDTSLRCTGAGREGYIHNHARGVRPSLPATFSMRVRWYVERIAPAETALASGWFAMTRFKSGVKDSVSSWSWPPTCFSSDEAELEPPSRYTRDVSTAPPVICSRYRGTPKAASYSGITLWPMVWYMKLSVSSSSSSSPPGPGFGYRFASATTVWPLRIQCRME